MVRVTQKLDVEKRGQMERVKVHFSTSRSILLSLTGNTRVRRFT